MSLIALSIGVLSSIAFYFLMSTQLSRWLYGLILISSIINLCILISGRVYQSNPAFIGQDYGLTNMGNPLPQAMILTAIVISLGLIALSLVILRTLYSSEHSTLDELSENKLSSLNNEK